MARIPGISGPGEMDTLAKEGWTDGSGGSGVVTRSSADKYSLGRYAIKLDNYSYGSNLAKITSPTVSIAAGWTARFHAKSYEAGYYSRSKWQFFFVVGGQTHWITQENWYDGRGTPLEIWVNGSSKATGASNCAISPYQTFIVRFVPGAGAAGTITVLVDGTTKVSYAGTNNGGGDTTTAFGFQVTGVNNGYPGDNNLYIDDFVVNDLTGSYNNSDPGEGCVTYRPLNAAGSSAEWVPSTGLNHTTIDELDSNTTDFNESPTPGDEDSLGVENCDASTKGIFAAEPVFYCKYTGSGITRITPTLKIGSTLHDAPSDVTAGVAYAWKSGAIWEAQPVTGYALTATVLNAAEAGYRSKA